MTSTPAPADVLVTGAGGRLGRHVVRTLVEHGSRVVGLIARPDEAAPVDGLVSRLVVGDAHDPAVAAEAVAGVEAVVHLAAIPAPMLAAAPVVFGNNTLATFTVLHAAGEAGVGRAVIASSIALLGLSFSPYDATPPWLPIDVDVPTQAADPYALSKVADEATAAMANRRWGMTVTALRFPFLGTPEDRGLERQRQVTDDPSQGRPDVWSYLDTRDAATAVRLSLGRAGGDYEVVGLAAPDNLTPYPSEQLLDAYLPDVPRRTAFPGRASMVDTARAERILGFRAEHLWPVEPSDLEAPR